MTRTEHIQWCKERAIQEFDYYAAKQTLHDAIQNGVISIMSDIRKHNETNSSALQSLCMMQLTGGMIRSREEFVTFINGFN